MKRGRKIDCRRVTNGAVVLIPFQARPPGRGEAGRGHGGLREDEAGAASIAAAAETARQDGGRRGRRRQHPQTQQNAKTHRCDAAKVKKLSHGFKWFKLFETGQNFSNFQIERW